jgi:hypothetical protein
MALLLFRGDTNVRVVIDDREWVMNGEAGAARSGGDTAGEVAEPPADDAPAETEVDASGDEEAGYGYGV